MSGGGRCRRCRRRCAEGTLKEERSCGQTHHRRTLHLEISLYGPITVLFRSRFHSHHPSHSQEPLFGDLNGSSAFEMGVQPQQWNLVTQYPLGSIEFFLLQPPSPSFSQHTMLSLATKNSEQKAPEACPQTPAEGHDNAGLQFVSEGH